MSVNEYLKQLEQELRTLSRAERENALNYYREYLGDAEDAQTAMRSLGTPQKVAQDILREIGSVPAVSNNPFEPPEESKPSKITAFFRQLFRKKPKNQDKTDLKSEPPKQDEPPKQAKPSEKKKTRTGSLDRGQKLLLIVLFIVCAVSVFPVSIGLIGGLSGVLMGIVFVILSMFLFFLSLSAAFFAASVVTLISMVGCAPAVMLAMFGVACILMGLSLLCFAAFLWMCRTLIPSLMRSIINGIRSLVKPKGGAKK